MRWILIKHKQIFRIFGSSAIYIAIAGTFTGLYRLWEDGWYSRFNLPMGDGYLWNFIQIAFKQESSSFSDNLSGHGMVSNLAFACDHCKQLGVLSFILLGGLYTVGTIFYSRRKRLVPFHLAFVCYRRINRSFVAIIFISENKQDLTLYH